MPPTRTSSAAVADSNVDPQHLDGSISKARLRSRSAVDDKRSPTLDAKRRRPTPPIRLEASRRLRRIFQNRLAALQPCRLVDMEIGLLPMFTLP